MTLRDHLGPRTPQNAALHDDKPRYGRRRIDRMLLEWNRLRVAVYDCPDEAVLDAFRACEEWVWFAFGAAAEKPEGGAG